MPRTDHDYGYFLWTVPGFLLSFGVVTVLSIGIPIFLAGVCLLAYLYIRGPSWPADLGLIGGVGLAGLLFACIAIISGDYSASPWLQIGAGMVFVSAGAFWYLRCRPSVRAR